MILHKIRWTFVLYFFVIPATDSQTNYNEFFQELQYRCIGPTRGGRVTTVAGHSEIRGTFFMGTSGGGLWKTEDYGHSWENVSDGYFDSPSLGAVRIAPSDPGIIYAGTGSDGLRSNVITGKGIYRSDDNGITWSHLGLENSGHIGAVEIHPFCSDTVYVAAIGNAFTSSPSRGVYRSFDGGSTWDRVLYLSDTVGAADLEICPSNPNIIYAGMWRAERKPWTIISGGTEGGLYRSTDGGNTWVKLTAGLPSGLVGKTDLAVCLAAPNSVWALIEAPPGEGGVYRSDDRGLSWHLISTKDDLLDRPFYFCNIDVNPVNKLSIYVSATKLWHSSNGGRSWQTVNTPHVDNHDIWIDPKDTLVIIQANDGGANISRNGGKTWSTQQNQPTAELYQVEADDQFPYWIYGGQQDNTTIAVPSIPPYTAPSNPVSYWRVLGGCETGPAVPKPGNPNIVYSNCKGEFGVYNQLTGQEQNYFVGATNMYGHNPADLKFRFQRVAPIHVSTHNPSVIYHASQYVHKTTEEGKSWHIISPDLTAFEEDMQVISGSPITRDITGEEFYSAIYSLQESPVQAGIIWTGANDGPVHVTRNSGVTWLDVTPGDLPPGGRVDAIEPSHHVPGRAYIAVLRYQLGDWRPFIFKTNDFGTKWELLTPGTNGIPDNFPTRVIREDPVKPGLLFAGTEFGIFISLNDGKTWLPFQQNLPVTPITDMKIHRDDLVISTMGRSFWILDDITLFRQINPGNDYKNVLFKPRDTYRIRYSPGKIGAIPSYPDHGLIIDYFLNGDQQKIQLEIRDAQNRLVKTYSTKIRDNSQSVNTSRNKNLNAGKGGHRFIWDLRHEGIWQEDKTQVSSGPMAAPGKYTLSMFLDDSILKRSFIILPDPRVIKQGTTVSDMEQQEKLHLQVRDLLSEVKKTTSDLKTMIEEKYNETDPESLSRAREMLDKLVTGEGRYMMPMLTDQISYLYRMLDQADQKPGNDAIHRYHELRNAFDELSLDLQTISD